MQNLRYGKKITFILVQCSWWSYCCRIAFTLTVFLFIYSFDFGWFIFRFESNALDMHVYVGTNCDTFLPHTSMSIQRFSYLVHGYRFWVCARAHGVVINSLVWTNDTILLHVNHSVNGHCPNTGRRLPKTLAHVIQNGIARDCQRALRLIVSSTVN